MTNHVAGAGLAVEDAAESTYQPEPTGTRPRFDSGIATDSRSDGRERAEHGDSTLNAIVRDEVRRALRELSLHSIGAIGLTTPGLAEARRDLRQGRDPDGETMDVKELVALLRLNRKTVYNLITLGRIPGVRRLGRRIVVHRSTVLHWLRNGQGSVPRSRRKP